MVTPSTSRLQCPQQWTYANCRTRRDKGVWLLPAFLSEQPQAPEARMALAAYHQMVVDGDAQRFCRLPDLARHLDVVARWLGVATGVVMDQSTLEKIFRSVAPLMRFATSAGIAEWCMFLVLTRDFPRSSTTRLRRLHSNTFEHGFRILRLLCTVITSRGSVPAHLANATQMEEAGVARAVAESPNTIQSTLRFSYLGGPFHLRRSSMKLAQSRSERALALRIRWTS
jgi:hypothetical protein